jgi:transcription termination/antitermination protein NusG
MVNTRGKSMSQAVLLAETPQPKWHVMWTRSQCEQLVYDQLTPKGYQLFLPMIDVWKRHQGRRAHERVPMFPGYLFLHHVMDAVSYLEVARTQGLVKLLGRRWDELAEVPAAQVLALQKVRQAGLQARPHLYLHEGERVRITGGLLEGAEGILLRKHPNKGLLVVSIDLLQRSVAVEVDCTLAAPA